jgi:hypothetical protein
MAAGVKMQNITIDKSQRFGDADYSRGTFTATVRQARSLVIG